MKQLMISFEGVTAPSVILEAVRRGQISSFCLFADKNVHSLSQLRALTQSLHDAARAGGHPPPLIGIDQEGGQLIAITHGATELPGNMALGATRSKRLAKAAGRVLAKELLALGINLNFAPVLDVNTNPQNPVIGIRSFGDTPQLVTDLGLAMIKGMAQEGVVASAKHFPGHGDSTDDTHVGLARVDFGRPRIDAIELVPFKQAIAAQVASILMGHIIFTELDDENPASVSPIIIQDVLRKELGFDGLIITDAMDMHAVAQRGEKQCVIDALQAGNDLVLLGHLPNQLALLQALSHLENPEAVKRIDVVRQQLPRQSLPLKVIGSPEHQQVAQHIAEASITVVKDETPLLPLELAPNDLLVVLQPKPRNLTPADTSAAVEVKMSEALQQYHPTTIKIPYRMDLDEHEMTAVITQCHDAKTIIIGTINTQETPQQAKLVDILVTLGKPLIVVALRTPYDILDFTHVTTYLCTYGIRDESMQALAKIIMGQLTASGKLPCTLANSQRS